MRYTRILSHVIFIVPNLSAFASNNFISARSQGQDFGFEFDIWRRSQTKLRRDSNPGPQGA